MKKTYARYLALSALLMQISAAASLAGDGLVALQTADPSCPDNSGAIYVDCENGTVTDNRTGLVWLANANCWTDLSWREAMERVAALADIANGSVAANDDCGLSDNSSPGEWRLPSVSEWEDMISNALGQGGDPDCTGGGSGPAITNDAGTDCWQAGGSSFSNVLSGPYWAATTVESTPNYAWSNFLLTGTVTDLFEKTDRYRVWPVRGGQ